MNLFSLLQILAGLGFLNVVLTKDENTFDLDLPFDPNNVTLTLHTPFPRTKSRIIINVAESVKNYDRLRGLKVLIHGMSESDHNGWMINTRDAFLDMGFNVITVDWSPYSESWNFARAKEYTKLVGEWVAKIIQWLNDVFEMENDEHHVIGFSLGAHVAGVMGYNLQNPKLARITGLDPAGPYFTTKPLTERLDKSDAQFVDVIHTNGGTLMSGGLGFLTSLGHVDFYPNGGQRQPGCIEIVLKFVNGALVFPYATPSSTCSHSRATKYYLESIRNSDTFRSFSCSDKKEYERGNCTDYITSNRMGFYARSALEGDFYLATRAEDPYNANDVVSTWTIARNQTQTAGTITISLEGEGYKEKRILLDQRTITAGVVLAQVIGVRPEMRSIDKIVFKFEKRLGTYGLLQVESVELFNVKRQTRYCVDDFEVESGSPRMLPTRKC